MKLSLSELFAAKSLDFTCSKCNAVNTVKLDDSDDINSDEENDLEEELETLEEQDEEREEQESEEDPDENEFDDKKSTMNKNPILTATERLAKALSAAAKKASNSEIKSENAGRPSTAAKLAKSINQPADAKEVNRLSAAIKKAKREIRG